MILSFYVWTALQLQWILYLLYTRHSITQLEITEIDEMHKVVLTSTGSVAGIEMRVDLSACRNASIDGFFFGLTSANSSVT